MSGAVEIGPNEVGACRMCGGQMLGVLAYRVEITPIAWSSPPDQWKPSASPRVPFYVHHHCAMALEAAVVEASQQLQARQSAARDSGLEGGGS